MARRRPLPQGRPLLTRRDCCSHTGLEQASACRWSDDLERVVVDQRDAAGAFVADGASQCRHEDAAGSAAHRVVETLFAETTRLLLDDQTAHETRKALGYFKTNAHCMRYAYFRDHGMFIGLGTVEAGCKGVIAQRLKLSGMRWNIPGATGILTLRCQQASNRFDHIWMPAAQPDLTA